MNGRSYLAFLVLDGLEVPVIVTWVFTSLLVRIHIAGEFLVLPIRQKKDSAIGATG
jgi:hypothetical protein